MAISSENRKTGIFTGDGKTTRYPFDFRILKTEHIAVITDDAIGNEHILSEGRDYTAALETDGGHIDLAAPLAKGRRLVIVSTQPYLQPTAASTPPLSTTRWISWSFKTSTSANRSAALSKSPSSAA